jgi:hypothetical protein
MFRRNFGDHSVWLRGLGCCVFGCLLWPVEIGHTVTRKAGGCGSDWRKTVPLCGDHHKRQEGRTNEFGAENGVNLHALADALVVADPNVITSEQIAAWGRLEAYSHFDRLGALQRGFDLTGYLIEPPRVADHQPLSAPGGAGA